MKYSAHLETARVANWKVDNVFKVCHLMLIFKAADIRRFTPKRRSHPLYKLYPSSLQTKYVSIASTNFVIYYLIYAILCN